MLKLLEAAERVLGLGGRFRYVHQLEDSDARVAILEFATEVDGRQVEGIDKLTFDDDGRITELKVMLRPASALQVVAGADGRGIRAPRARLARLRTVRNEGDPRSQRPARTRGVPRRAGRTPRVPATVAAALGRWLPEARSRTSLRRR